MADAATFTDTFTTGSSGHLPPAAPHLQLNELQLTDSAPLVILTIIVGIVLIGYLWPESREKMELFWTVAPRDAERARIWRLILPNEALDFGDAASKGPPAPEAAAGATVVKRLSNNLGVARLLSPDGRRGQQSAWEHNWTFRPQTEAARDRTPLLVFINRASGGRQGEATLVQLRALLSPQQVR